MIIILGFITIGFLISIAFWKSENKKIEGIIAGIVCSVFILIICSCVWGKSYTRYLDDRAFYTATKEQYFSAIEVYTNYAVIDMGKAAFTDFRYSGYQSNVAHFVTSLRNRIIKYNKSIVKKRVQGKNPIFSWLIIEPDDDMLIIKMKVE
jgi:hypothetical protein